MRRGPDGARGGAFPLFRGPAGPGTAPGDVPRGTRPPRTTGAGPRPVPGRAGGGGRGSGQGTAARPGGVGPPSCPNRSAFHGEHERTAFGRGPPLHAASDSRTRKAFHVEHASYLLSVRAPLAPGAPCRLPPRGVPRGAHVLGFSRRSSFHVEQAEGAPPPGSRRPHAILPCSTSAPCGAPPESLHPGSSRRKAFHVEHATLPSHAPSRVTLGVHCPPLRSTCRAIPGVRVQRARSTWNRYRRPVRRLSWRGDGDEAPAYREGRPRGFVFHVEPSRPGKTIASGQSEAAAHGCLIQVPTHRPRLVPRGTAHAPWTEARLHCAFGREAARLDVPRGTRTSGPPPLRAPPFSAARCELSTGSTWNIRRPGMTKMAGALRAGNRGTARGDVPRGTSGLPLRGLLRALSERSPPRLFHVEHGMRWWG